MNALVDTGKEHSCGEKGEDILEEMTLTKKITKSPNGFTFKEVPDISHNTECKRIRC